MTDNIVIMVLLWRCMATSLKQTWQMIYWKIHITFRLTKCNIFANLSLAYLFSLLLYWFFVASRSSQMHLSWPPSTLRRNYTNLHQLLYLEQRHSGFCCRTDRHDTQLDDFFFYDSWAFGRIPSIFFIGFQNYILSVPVCGVVVTDRFDGYRYYYHCYYYYYHKCNGNGVYECVVWLFYYMHVCMWDGKDRMLFVLCVFLCLSFYNFLS